MGSQSLLHCSVWSKEGSGYTSMSAVTCVMSDPCTYSPVSLFLYAEINGRESGSLFRSITQTATSQRNTLLNFSQIKITGFDAILLQLFHLATPIANFPIVFLWSCPCRRHCIMLLGRVSQVFTSKPQAGRKGPGSLSTCQQGVSGCNHSSSSF